jgi:hypothetical protein
MRQSGPTSSSTVDDEGVRVLRKASAPRFGIEARLSAGIALIVAAALAVSLSTSGRTEPDGDGVAADTTKANRNSESPVVAASPDAADVMHRPEASPAERAIARPAPQGDPNDLASYFRPGDPVPSTANLIKAMNEAGIRSGIAAFNPPGTSPPLEGLAVPPDFELPPGYVRHHQATDEGGTIEPILMFSPDLVLRDAQGRPIPLPANRVVPPELAPPGLPLRWVRPGKS